MSASAPTRAYHAPDRYRVPRLLPYSRRLAGRVCADAMISLAWPTNGRMGAWTHRRADRRGWLPSAATTGDALDGGRPSWARGQLDLAQDPGTRDPWSKIQSAREGRRHGRPLGIHLWPPTGSRRSPFKRRSRSLAQNIRDREWQGAGFQGAPGCRKRPRPQESRFDRGRPCRAPR